MAERLYKYCPVCTSDKTSLWSQAMDYEYFSVTGKFNYYSCHQCLTIFIDPVPTELLYQIYPPNYYSFKGRSSNPVFRIKEWLDRRFFRKILEDIPGPELSVLDVGGGSGWILSMLKLTDKRIRNTQVVDIDHSAGELATRNGHKYHEGTIESFNTDQRYDLIIMLNLVEHVSDPLSLMQKAAGLLSPTGKIVIKTPNTDSWDARVFRKTYWGGLHCPRHWRIFSAAGFRQLIHFTPLQIEKLRYTQGAPFWAFSIIAAMHRRKWVRISSQKPIIFHWLFPPVSALFALIDWIRKPFAKTSQMFLVLTRRQ